MQDGHATNFVTDVCLIARGWPLGRPGCFLQERHQKHAAEPRDLPCLPAVGLASSPQTVGARVSVRARLRAWVGLVCADARKNEIDDGRPSRIAYPSCTWGELQVLLYSGI